MHMMMRVIFVSLAFAGAAQAQEHFAYCAATSVPSQNSQNDYYRFFGDVFPIPATAKILTLEDGQRTLPEAVDPFTKAKSPTGALADNGWYPYCLVFDTKSAAEFDKAKTRAATMGAGFPVPQAFETHWIYSPMSQMAVTSTEKPTEADAIYDAETRTKTRFAYGKYPTVHSWDQHVCEPHSRKTSTYANAKTITTYTCTVTFSYSDIASPVARAAIGSGASQDIAVTAAKASITGVQWAQPLCSKTFKPNAYQAKPSYKVGDNPAGADWWVCEVDYIAAQ